MCVRWISAWFVLAIATSPCARAGFVTIDSAEARITFLGPTASDPPNTRSQAVELGDFEQFTYDGGIPGDSRGDGLVFYSFQPFKGAFQLFVQVKHQSFALPHGAGGNASFNLTFTTDVDLRYTFESNVLAPPAFFSAIAQPINATAQFAGNNTWTSTIPQTTNDAGEVDFDVFTSEGIIPAGRTTFVTVDAVTYDSAQGNPSKSDGYLRFNVEPVAIPIPLPPAIWSIASSIMAGAVVWRLKRRA